MSHTSGAVPRRRLSPSQPTPSEVSIGIPLWVFQPVRNLCSVLESDRRLRPNIWICPPNGHYAIIFGEGVSGVIEAGDVSTDSSEPDPGSVNVEIDFFIDERLYPVFLHYLSEIGPFRVFHGGNGIRRMRIKLALAIPSPAINASPSISAEKMPSTILPPFPGFLLVFFLVAMVHAPISFQISHRLDKLCHIVVMV